MFSPSNIYSLATITPSGVAGTLNIASDTVLYIRPLTASETANIPTATCAIAYVPQVSGASGEPIEVYSTTAAATINTALEATFTATVSARGALTFSPAQTWYFGAALVYAPSLATSGSGAKFQMDFATVDTYTVTESTSTIISRIAAAKSAADLPSTVMLTSQNNTMSGTFGVRFGAATESINSSVAGQLDIDAATEVEVTAPTVQIAAATELEVNAGIVDINATTLVTVDGTAITATGSTSVAMVSGLASVSTLTLGGEVDITSTTLDINAATTDISGITVNSGIDTRIGAGAISLTAAITQVRTTGADALTLADGTNGQLKEIVMTVDGGDGTLTPATATGFATIAFNDAGDYIVLRFFTTLGWMIVSNYGCTIA